MSQRLIIRMNLAVALLLSAACADTSSNGPIMGGGDEAQLTIINALVSAKPLSSLQLDGSAVTLPGVGGARGLAIDGGAHRLEAIDSAGRTMAHADFDVGAGGRRTAILTGTSSGVLLQVASDTASLPVAGSAKIRVVHMAEGTSLLDAYLYRDYEVPDSSTRLMTAFSIGQGTATEFPGYCVRQPWAYKVRVTVTGSMNPLAESPAFHALSGEIWSVILTRTSDGALTLQPIKER